MSLGLSLVVSLLPRALFFGDGDGVSKLMGLSRVSEDKVFFVGLSWMQQREATTRRNDLSARLADSVSRPNGQLTRAG